MRAVGPGVALGCRWLEDRVNRRVDGPVPQVIAVARAGARPDTPMRWSDRERNPA